MTALYAFDGATLPRDLHRSDPQSRETSSAGGSAVFDGIGAANA